MEIEHICRTCLCRAGTLHSIHNPAAPNANITLAEVLSKFLSVKPVRGDGLPEQICLSCICDLTYLYNFTQKCEESDRNLRQFNLSFLANDMGVPGLTLQYSDASALDNFGHVFVSQLQQNGTQSGPGSSPERGASIFEPTINVKTEITSEDENEMLFPTLRTCDVQLSPNFYESRLPTEMPELKVANAIKEELHVESDDDIPISNLSIIKASSVLLATGAQCTKDNYEMFEASTTITDANANAECDQNDSQWHEGRLRRKCRMQNALVNSEPLTLAHTKGLKGSSGARGQQRSNRDKSDIEAEPKDTFVCEICNAGFASKNAIALHRRRKICTVIQHECHRCGRFFASAQHLCDHMVLYAISCDQCDNHFSNMDELDAHIVNTHVQKRDYICDICHKRFAFYSGLKAHKRTHTDERPFQCKICGKRFQQKGNMKLHQIRHGETKPFQCEQCPKTFFIRSELALHERSHTTERPYKCDICGKGYLSSNQLSNHRRGHTGERPYACELCNSRFRLLSTLKSHHRTHTGEKPFQCKYCSRRFSDKSNCRIHERKHPEDNPL